MTDRAKTSLSFIQLELHLPCDKVEGDRGSLTIILICRGDWAKVDDAAVGVFDADVWGGTGLAVVIISADGWDGVAGDK